jgi:hypothetical protein
MTSCAARLTGRGKGAKNGVHELYTSFEMRDRSMSTSSGLAPREKTRSRRAGPHLALALMSLACACSADRTELRQSARGDSPAAGAMGAPPVPPAVQVASPGSAPPRAAEALVCTVPSEDDAFKTSECELQAPPGSFDPVEQWHWEGGDGQGPPLVANLTDDNADGAVDLCDTPDVVVLAGASFDFDTLEAVSAKLHVLDGQTGTEHCATSIGVEAVTPAIADIDGDRVPEIIAIKSLLDGFVNDFDFAGLIVFDNNCEMKWQADLRFRNLVDQLATLSISVHDVDADGDVELLVGTALFDHNGELLWNKQFELLNSGLGLASTTADLNGDGDLEIITGNRAYHPDGVIWFENPDLLGYFNPTDLIGFYPAVANLDADPEPEIVVAGGQGLFVLDHNGLVQAHFTSGDHGWFDLGEISPPTIHDFDGDGEPEIALGTRNGFAMFEQDLTVKWMSDETEGVLTGATAFDFLGDGVAEAIYADRDELLVFDGATGEVVMRAPRTGALDYPVIADVDNDGAAELVVVSGASEFFQEKIAPTVQVIRDREERWIPTRRIWNQLNYYVTNVREDGTIPARPKPAWQVHNTYRTNIQLEAGGICTPVPD